MRTTVAVLALVATEAATAATTATRHVITSARMRVLFIELSSFVLVRRVAPLQ
jgi:hypothetical protein